MKYQILPTITTTNKKDIQKKIAETRRLNINRCCLFLTGLGKIERENLYSRLKNTPIKEIPFVHLRSDMEISEVEFLVTNYCCQIFNIHPQKEYPLKYNLSVFKKMIYIENTSGNLDEEEVEKFAGVCVDFSHLEKMRLQNSSVYKHNLEIIKKYPCGCGHISASKEKPNIIEGFLKLTSSHVAKRMSDFNYLKRYKEIFPPIIALELENSLEEQIKIRDYILKNI